MILVVPYLWLSIYRSNLCKNECELSFMENEMFSQGTVISICFMTELGVGMVCASHGYKFVKPDIIFRWCK